MISTSAFYLTGVKSSRFLSETELEENKAKHGERLEDGTFAGRSLQEALAANKATKEETFRDAWKQMKQGTLAIYAQVPFSQSLAVDRH
jgi:hypothetical protein